MAATKSNLGDLIICSKVNFDNRLSITRKSCLLNNSIPYFSIKVTIFSGESEFDNFSPVVTEKEGISKEGNYTFTTSERSDTLIGKVNLLEKKRWRIKNRHIEIRGPGCRRSILLKEFLMLL